MSGLPIRAPRGRGAAANPRNRFERLEVEPEEPGPDRVPTVFYRDHSRSAIATNESPDVGFDASVNPYRGCEHGCIYCYARPFHEYLGFSAGLDFETRILVKEGAPELLARELAAPGWQPRVLALSGVTDPYQPIERRLEITRRCLAVLAEACHPVAIITKSTLVCRDADLLAQLAAHGAAVVTLSLTTLDAELARAMEPRASHPRRRLEAISTLAAAGVPVGASLAPMIPALTDHEIPSLVAAVAEAGASFATFGALRLPGAVAQLFESWLAEHVPDRRERVLARQRDLRGGRLDDPRFGRRMRGEGIFADQMAALFSAACRRSGLATRPPRLETAAFRRPGGDQLSLFGG